MKNDLQQLIDQFVQSESGAELLYNVNHELGAVADMFVSAGQKSIAYQLLMPPDAMGFDRIRAFDLQDFLLQKDKQRLVLRSTGGVIYILRLAKSPDAIHTVAFNPLSNEEKDVIRGTLMSFLHSK